MRVAIRPESPLERAGLGAGLVPTPLWDAYCGWMAGRTIMAGAALGVFAALDEAPADAAGLADRLGLAPAGADALLVALHTLRYVDRDGRGRYRPARAAARFLVPGRRGSLHPYIGVFAYDMWAAWDSVEEVVRSGRPIGLHDRDPDDPHWERYMRGLHALAAHVGPTLARAVGGRRPRSLLDLAGGHGGYAVALCRRHPDLRAVVVDLEGAARVGRRLVAEDGFGDRIAFRVGDLFAADLGADHDVALAASILHHLEPAACVRLLARARSALRPGGRMAAFELERPRPGRRGQQLSVLTGLMFYVYSGARTYSGDELAAFFRQAGYARVRVKRPARLAGNVVVVGRA